MRLSAGCAPNRGPEDIDLNGPRVMTLAQVLARLYASEINVSVSAFWDAGWDVRLGDSLNGFRAQTTVWGERSNVADCEASLAVIASWLDEQARLHWPDSVYAREAATS